MEENLMCEADFEPKSKRKDGLREYTYAVDSDSLGLDSALDEDALMSHRSNVSDIERAAAFAKRKREVHLQKQVAAHGGQQQGGIVFPAPNNAKHIIDDRGKSSRELRLEYESLGITVSK
mmetsp:Transcript_80430/g.140335  ORF Transcript_80430/g.140335 Transcript_80430/m.140335 type:complete len:120 (+) Transcript_80430:3-362(+)